MGTSSATAWPKSQLCVKVLCLPNRTAKKVGFRFRSPKGSKRLLHKILADGLRVDFMNTAVLIVVYQKLPMDVRVGILKTDSWKVTVRGFARSRVNI